MTKKPKQKSKNKRPPAPRGRPPERVLKINDTPENVARPFFGIKSPKYVRPE